MPNHPKSHIVMICTGTGSAPMRAMTEWRRRLRKSGKFEGGKLMLFFGARTQQELPYFGPLQTLPKDFIDINFAFSRTPGQPKRYVQDLMRERAADLAALLKDGRTPLLRLRPEEHGGGRGAGAARRRRRTPGSTGTRVGASAQARRPPAPRDLLMPLMKFAEFHAGQVIEAGPYLVTEAEVAAVRAGLRPAVVPHRSGGARPKGPSAD